MIWYLVYGILLGVFVLVADCFFAPEPEPEPEPPPEPKTEHAGIFTHEEALRLSAVRDCFNEMEEHIERHTSGAEYDSTC